jgi:hypothetical protein
MKELFQKCIMLYVFYSFIHSNQICVCVRDKDIQSYGCGLWREQREREWRERVDMIGWWTLDGWTTENGNGDGRSWEWELGWMWERHVGIGGTTTTSGNETSRNNERAANEA